MRGVEHGLRGMEGGPPPAVEADEGLGKPYAEIYLSEPGLYRGGAGDDD